MKKDKTILTFDKEGNLQTSSIDKNKQVKNDEVAKSFRYVNIGFYLVTPLLAGVFLGLWLDSKFHTKPWITIVGISIGTIASFYNLIKLTNE